MSTRVMGERREGEGNEAVCSVDRVAVAKQQGQHQQQHQQWQHYVPLSPLPRHVSSSTSVAMAKRPPVASATRATSTSPAASTSSAASTAATPLPFLWFDLATFSSLVQFVALSTSVFVFFLINGLFEEYLFHSLDGFHFGWFLTWFEVTSFAALATLERTLRGGSHACLQRNAPLSMHVAVGLAMTASRGLTNVSLQYLSYPTQVVFKSMKLLTVMVGSLLFLKQSFTRMECFSSVALVISAVSFSFGDSVAVDGSLSAPSSSTPSTTSLPSSSTGLVVVGLSLIADAMHATSQDSLVHAHRASPLETMLFTNVAGSFFSLVCTALNGELHAAVSYVLFEQPIALALLSLRSLVLYFGVLTVITFVKTCGAFVSTTGFVMFCTSLCLNAYDAYQKQHPPPLKEEKEKDKKL